MDMSMTCIAYTVQSGIDVWRIRSLNVCEARAWRRSIRHLCSAEYRNSCAVFISLLPSMRRLMTEPEVVSSYVEDINSFRNVA